jgi:hypothetical protein
MPAVQTRVAFSVLTAAAIAALVALTSAPAPSQEKPKSKAAIDQPVPAGPTPRAKDGRPDLSGVWTPKLENFGNIGTPPLQPWAEKLYKERRANLSKDDPEGFCLPTGVPRIAPFPYKIVQTPKLIVMLFEGNIHSYRQFFMDGRGHPGDLDPLWFGHSIAWWEGDTLVVDTVSFNDRTWLNGQGYPHSDALHVIERYQRPDMGHLEIDITLEDPKAFTRPHTFHRSHTLLTAWEIHEYVCNEFNVDVDRLVGK